MSGIRKYLRKKHALNKPKKIKSRLTISDTVLIIGLTLCIVGALQGMVSNLFFNAGRTEAIISGDQGNIYIQHEDPGKLKYKNAAKYSMTIFTAGIIISAAAWINIQKKTPEKTQ